MTATRSTSPDVIVVGGGAVGLGTAWRLAQRGLDVEVVDPQPGGGASGVAAGMLAPVTEARLGEIDLLRLSLASWERWPAFVAEVEAAAGRSVGYRADGTVVVALDADDRVALADLVDRQRSLGLVVDDLQAKEVRALEPALAPGVRRGALAAGERAVDPAALVGALGVAAERIGVRFRHEQVAALLTTGDRDPGPYDEPGEHGENGENGRDDHAGRRPGRPAVEAQDAGGVRGQVADETARVGHTGDKGREAGRDDHAGGGRGWVADETAQAGQTGDKGREAGRNDHAGGRRGLVAHDRGGEVGGGGGRAADNRGGGAGGGRVAAEAELGDRRVVGVELVGGRRIAAPTVVLSAGAWSTDLAGLPARARPPVRPVKGQVVTLRQRPGDALVRHTVRAFVRGSTVYLVPRDDGRVVCGATVEERGWDTTVTAGGTYELLRDAIAVFPGLDEAEMVGVRAGFRPGTPDDLPLIGASVVGGLVVATGHYRNGILLTPITAEAVADVVTGAEPPVEVQPCDPRRFARVRARA